MDKEDLPEPWRMAAERAGIRQSLRGIAEAAGVGHPTVGRLIEGGSTSPKTISLVASVLRVTEEHVREWAGAKAPAGEPWEPPEASRLLTGRQRVALTALINAMVEREGGSDARGAEPGKKTAGEGEPRVEKPLTLAERRRRRMLEQGQPAEEAADDRGPRPDYTHPDGEL